MGISVVIPLYNGAAFVGEALESVFRQTRLPEEVIVVDDCSTDDSVAVVQRAAAGAPVSVQVLRLERNSGGPAQPINVGVEAARGDMVLVLDQDDVLLPETLQRHAAGLERAPEGAFSISMAGYRDAPARQLAGEEVWRDVRGLAREAAGALVIPGRALLRLLVLRSNFVRGFPGFAFRRSAWQRCGGVRTRWRIGGDLDFLCRLCAVGEAVYVPYVGYCRTEHAGNMCRDGLRVKCDVAEILSEQLSQHPGLRSDPEVQKSVRWRILEAAREARRQGEFGRGLSMCRLAVGVPGGRRRAAGELARLAGELVRRLVGMRRPQTGGADSVETDLRRECRTAAERVAR